MVRIQQRLSRKRYLGGKYAYEYERLSLDIPKKFHKIKIQMSKASRIRINLRQFNMRVGNVRV